MVTDALAVKLSEISGTSQPDETEIAAGIAAVIAFMQEEPAASSPVTTTGSGWMNASLLEGCGGAKVQQSATGKKLSLWQRATFVKFCFAVCFMLATSSASAAPQESDWLEDDDATVTPQPQKSFQGPAYFHLNNQANNQIASSKKYANSASSSDSTQYSGNSSASAPSPTSTSNIFASTVRVGLSIGTSHTDITTIDGSRVIDAQSGANLATLSAGNQWSADFQSAATGPQIAISNKRANDFSSASSSSGAGNTKYGASRYRNVGYFPNAAVPRTSSIRLAVKPAIDGVANSSGYILQPISSNGVTAVDGKLYRGSVYLKPTGNGFTVINVVNLEDYVLSVLPSEMPSSWALEALKAQAIAARSYAVANQNKHGKDGFDLSATISDQVYSGISSESESSNRAVAETEGMVLKYQGKPITAFFHSTSGGATELAENVWSKPLPYLQAVADYDDSSPHFSWNRKFAVSDIEKALPGVGQLLSFDVVARTPSKRAQYVLAQGTHGAQMISGEAMRKIFKLPSSLFNVGSEDNSYVFAGRGFGHGLGMSQYGARALADRGYNAAQILSYYYKDVVVDFIGTAPGI